MSRHRELDKLFASVSAVKSEISTLIIQDNPCQIALIHDLDQTIQL
jgi:hypothetical protein